MALHQDALGLLGDGPPPERAFELVKLGEAAQDDVDRALPLLAVAIGVGDIGEDAPLGSLPDEAGIGRVDERDHRACRLVHDPLDHAQGMIESRA